MGAVLQPQRCTDWPHGSCPDFCGMDHAKVFKGHGSESSTLAAAACMGGYSSPRMGLVRPGLTDSALVHHKAVSPCRLTHALYTQKLRGWWQPLYSNPQQWWTMTFSPRRTQSQQAQVGL